MNKGRRFAPVPAISRTKIDKAGKILIKGGSFDQFFWAVDVAEAWRAAHAYPINTFQATLRRKLSTRPGDYLVAQRLKRMPTIIQKLKRFPAMQLTTMQDIGGVRAVLSTKTRVYSLAKEYKNRTRFEHELVNEMDYIESPNPETGYRSLHLIYKYRNSQNPSYDDLRLELQLRTKLQHIWATAVETMGTFLGQSLKSRQGDQDWIDFFAVVSTAFATREKSPQVPRYFGMRAKDITVELTRLEKKLGALNMMEGLSTVVSLVNKAKWAYHLLVLDSFNGTVAVYGFDRYSLDNAMEEYAGYEKKAANGEPIEPVLVSAGPIDKLRKAYPNFFLDIGEFSREIGKLLKS